MAEEFDRKTISVREFSMVTGIAGSTTRKWLQDGDLKGIKVGKRKLAHSPQRTPKNNKILRRKET